MKRLFQLGSLFLIALTVALVIVLRGFFSHPGLNLNDRPIGSWKPDLEGTTVAFEPAGTTEGQSKWSETFTRPLFSPTRRPFVAPKQPEPEPVAEVQPPAEPTPEPVEPPPAPEPPPELPPPYDPGQFQLKGVLQNGENLAVLLATPDAPNGLWLSTGSEIMGWTIVNIDKNAVTLETGANKVVVQQYVEKSNQSLGTEGPSQ
jgi:hypothetical protein